MSDYAFLSGHLYKGPLQSGYTRISQPSIPSKFDQILLKPKSPKDGFGLRASRFCPASNRCPGPGSYSDRYDQHSPSFSQKGFLSAFISDAQRFAPKQYKTFVPGPGTYTPRVFHSNHNPALGFLSRGKLSPLKIPISPGPGEYDVTLPRKGSCGATNPFRSKTKRGENEGKKDGPAPWHYHPDDKIVKSRSQELTSIFHQPVNARRHKMNLYDPHEVVSEEVTPGPGYYENPRAFEGVNGSMNTSFARQERDRFAPDDPGLKAKALVPGPGSYSPTYQPSKKIPISGSAFMSESRRGDLSPRRVPGPAFYRPVPIPKKKSFLKNGEMKWI